MIGGLCNNRDRWMDGPESVSFLRLKFLQLPNPLLRLIKKNRGLEGRYDEYDGYDGYIQKWVSPAKKKGAFFLYPNLSSPLSPPLIDFSKEDIQKWVPSAKKKKQKGSNKIDRPPLFHPSPLSTLLMNSFSKQKIRRILIGDFELYFELFFQINGNRVAAIIDVKFGIWLFMYACNFTRGEL